ncbi:hypothetical protein JTB14_036969 [Gonioctena quinquepunctata]|nr:hypothetical protein JTB14_036969 [Gonioctena quinquepunctata]
MALISTKVYENNLRTLFALEGYLSFKQNWKLSKGRNVGIFDDLVFESDSRIILLQIKHSGHKELSDDNENEIHFYKYVLSSMINSHNDKTLFVLCTNRIISKELFEKGDDKMLYNILGDGKSMRYGKIYGINEDNKHVVMNEFHQKFRCIELADEDLVNAIRHKLQIIQKQLRYPVPEYMYMTEKMEELSKSEKSIRNNHFKDILYSHRNEKCIQYFLNGKTVPFTEQFSNMNHRIFNIKPGGEPYLTFMKVLESLQEKNSWESINNHILYLHPEDDFDTFTEMIGVFELDKYEILIMSLMHFTENEKINICSEITRLMSFDISKKVIVIADKVFFEDDSGVVEIDGQISFTI